jgi:hypothetical protein
MNVEKLASPAPLMDALPTLFVRPGRCHFSMYRNLWIGVWVGQADLPSVQGQLKVSNEMAARHPGGHSSVSFILDGLAGPTPEAQPTLKKVFAARAALGCAGIVLEGSGFWASGLRGMLNNAHREAGSRLMLKIETSVEQLVTWLAEEHSECTGVEIPPLQLCEVLLRARQHGEQAARG